MATNRTIAIRQVADPQALDFGNGSRTGRDYENGIRIRRKRKSWAPSSKEERVRIAKRVIDFYKQDMSDRSIEADLRLQRYAKYRMFTSGKDFPWPDSADIGLPDLMTQVQRTEDTLVNAVLSGMPPVTARATDPVDKNRQDLVDRVLMHQVFNDQPGTRRIADLAHAFAGPDGVATLFIPWVKDTRRVVDTVVLEGNAAPPSSGIPADFFIVRVYTEHPDAAIEAKSGGWDFTVTKKDGRKLEVSFYSRDDGSYEMVTAHEAEVFNGPCLIVKGWEDVLKPSRAKNLQPPSPSNPGGASHVILVDRDVTLDEIARLQRSKTYDLLDKDGLERLKSTGQAPSEESLAEQKDAIAGKATTRSEPPEDAKSHKTVTRLTCFDVYDIDGDGIDEDVIFTVILETEQLVRAKILTEMYPVDPPCRPLFSEDFLPEGVSLVELLESTHDAMKMQLDMTIDVGAITGVPWGLYRATGGIRPETMRIFPGGLSPVQDPQRDVVFPQMPNSQIATGINLITLLSQMQERTSMQGELQFGRVPQGKSSALRTLGGMQSVMMQGEARPERILGRFFGLLSDAWRFMHEMNRRMLEPDKVIRYVGPQVPDKAVYAKVESRDSLGGRYQFEFKANVFNTSRQALQQSLGMLMQTYLTPLAFQLGVMQPDGAYRMLRDFGQAHGQDPDQYLTPPSPDAMLPKISAEDALLIIIRGGVPYGRPLEPGGYQEHLQKLLDFLGTDQAGFLTAEMGAPEGAIDVLKKYMMEVRQRMLEDAQRQALLAAAAGEQQGGGQGGPAGAPQSATDAQAMPMISGGGEMLDESMPNAGGGANG